MVDQHKHEQGCPHEETYDEAHHFAPVSDALRRERMAVRNSSNVTSAMSGYSSGDVRSSLSRSSCHSSLIASTSTAAGAVVGSGFKAGQVSCSPYLHEP